MSQDFNLTLDDIQEVNLAYLMLAQKLLRQDMAEGMFRLGLNEQMAQNIVQLSPAQILKLARSSVLLCNFRLDEAQLLNILTQDVLGGVLQQAHSAILFTQQSEPKVGP